MLTVMLCLSFRQSLLVAAVAFEYLPELSLIGQIAQWLSWFPYAALVCILVILVIIDLRQMRLPDSLTLSGTALGLGLSFLPGSIGFQQAMLGLLLSGGVLYLISVVGALFFKRPAMGGGDIKMAAMIGAFLGWQKTAVVLFLSPILGAIVGVAVVFVQGKSLKNQVITFGPFLAASAIIAVLFGDSMIQWYLDWLTRI